jgi:phosphoribosylanthranilate isomerase
VNKTTYIKICGIRDTNTALATVDAGADAIGLVMYALSPRVVNIGEAAAISASVAGRLDVVALFVNPTTDEVKQVLTNVKPQILQFHGNESADFCAQFGMPYWKALRVNTQSDLLNLQAVFRSADRLLLDADHAGLYGGSGAIFDWQLIPSTMRAEIILSGGLKPELVRQAVEIVRPWGVDVSSGVEQSKGVKSIVLIRQFIEEVRRAHV